MQLIEAIWAKDFKRAQKIQVLLLEDGERIAPTAPTAEELHWKACACAAWR